MVAAGAIGYSLIAVAAVVFLWGETLAWFRCARQAG